MKLNSLLAVVLLSAALTSCARPLDDLHMRPMAGVIEQIPANRLLEHNVLLGNVSVPESYSTSTIGTFNSKGFTTALKETLLLVNYLVRQDDEPKYTLNASLVKLDIPTFGFSLDGTSVVDYSLVRNRDDKEVFRQTITQGYHAPFAESFDGNQRARIASENAMRENITQLIRMLAELNVNEL